MSRTGSKKEPASDSRSFDITVYPYTSYTVATVSVGWRDSAGPHRSLLARWHLRLSRSDLTGHSTDDVIRSIVDGLVRRLESGPDPADYAAPAVGTGVPLGTAGGTVAQDSLPGL